MATESPEWAGEDEGRQDSASTANVAPAYAVGIHRAVEAGDLAKARELQARLSPVRKLFGVGSHPAGLKEAMVQLGLLTCGKCRRPTLDLTPAHKEEIRKILKEIGLKG